MNKNLTEVLTHIVLSRIVCVGVPDTGPFLNLHEYVQMTYNPAKLVNTQHMGISLTTYDHYKHVRYTYIYVTSVRVTFCRYVIAFLVRFT